MFPFSVTLFYPPSTYLVFRCRYIDVHGRRTHSLHTHRRHIYFFRPITHLRPAQHVLFYLLTRCRQSNCRPVRKIEADGDLDVIWEEDPVLVQGGGCAVECGLCGCDIKCGGPGMSRTLIFLSVVVLTDGVMFFVRCRRNMFELF